MRILFLGDVMGRSGREAVAKHLPMLKQVLKPDVVIINGENSAHGIGITKDICLELYALGANCITTGNHVWDQREIIPHIDRDEKLLRPINFPKGTVGKGIYIYQTDSGEKIAIINAMARLFMDPLDDPFAILDATVKELKMGQGVQAIFIDFHGEATSEKMALAHYLDGRVSAVVGTHTHMPTADGQILPGGTAFQSDAGMCGDYNSVIGVRADISVHRFTKKMPGERMVPADGEATVCGTFIETNSKGLAVRMEPVRVGPRLLPHIPKF